MGELNTYLIVALIGFGTGVVTTLALVVLYAIYNNVNVVIDKIKDNDDDDDGMILPLSALMGGGAPGGGSRVSMADLQAYAARAAAGVGPPPGGPDDATKKTALSGQYL